MKAPEPGRARRPARFSARRRRMAGPVFAHRGALCGRDASPAIKWPPSGNRRNGPRRLPSSDRPSRPWVSSGLPAAAAHSARAAARRLPRSSIGSFSASIRPLTSSRAVTCDRLGRWPERVLVDVVERRQPARKIFAIDHAFGKTVDGAKTELLGQSFDTRADQPLVARAERREPVAHHDPVGQTAIDQPALPPRLADHFGIVADAGQLEGGRIDRRRARRNRRNCR